jgi:hypothetical protein
LDDHLYEVDFQSRHGNQQPLLLDMEKPIEAALTRIFDILKKKYPFELHRQAYVTIIESSILNGINSGNYDVHTKSSTIARWSLSQLYHFLKSHTTLRLNPSFKINIKVLSTRHTDDLNRNGGRQFTPHVVDHSGQ